MKKEKILNVVNKFRQTLDRLSDMQQELATKGMEVRAQKEKAAALLLQKKIAFSYVGAGYLREETIEYLKNTLGSRQLDIDLKALGNMLYTNYIEEQDIKLENAGAKVNTPLTKMIRIDDINDENASYHDQIKYSRLQDEKEAIRKEFTESGYDLDYIRKATEYYRSNKYEYRIDDDVNEYLHDNLQKFLKRTSK